MRRWAIALILAVLACGTSQAVELTCTTGTATLAVAIPDKIHPYAVLGTRTGEIAYTVALTSSDQGYTTTTLEDMWGAVVAVTVIPGTGDDAPTDDFDLVMRRNTVDAFGGSGADQSNAAAAAWCPFVTTGDNAMVVYLAGDYTLGLENAGDTNEVTVELLVLPR